MLGRQIVRALCWLLLIGALAAPGAAARSVVLDESSITPTPGDDRSTAATVWFQGFLADDATGDPINATYNVVARIYSAAGGGTLLWGPETHAAVTITEGWFNIELGATVSPLPTFASPPYYLSLQMNGEYLTPRLKLASVPSALQSAKSDLVPFSASYGGTSDGLYLTHTGTGGADGIAVERSGGASAGFAVYARNQGPAAALRAIQSYNAEAPYTSALLADVAAVNNDAPVVDALSWGTGPAFLGETDGLYALELYTDAGAAPADSVVHVIHAVYDGGERNAGNVAVYGESVGSDIWGVGGEFIGSGIGVIARAVPGPEAMLFYDGIECYSESVTDGENVGVYASAKNGADNYAGMFQGDVVVYGTLTKSAGAFRIDHPLDPANKYLSHSFVESPDMKNVYDGVADLDGAGEAWIELPEWFEALNRDFRYQLTPLGAPGPNLYVADEISGNRFRIAGGEPGMRVSWQVTGIRHDAYADAHRIPVEEVKSPREQGRYLNPELYGAPAGVDARHERLAAAKLAAGTARGRREAGRETSDRVDPARQRALTEVNRRASLMRLTTSHGPGPCLKAFRPLASRTASTVPLRRGRAREARASGARCRSGGPGRR